MQVTLAPEPESFVRSQIQLGNYQTPENAIAEGLRLLEECDRQREFSLNEKINRQRKIEK